MDKIAKILEILNKKYRAPHFIKRQNPFKVLITTILSQRTKDEITEYCAEKLFRKFSRPREFMNANIVEIEKLIAKVGFYRVKARRIQKIAKIIEEKYNGKVPDKITELLKLPGVGRKTASCTLLYGFNINCIPTDVHVAVISKRLRLTNKTSPEDVQVDLEKKIPREYWQNLNTTFVKFGKEICRTKSPKCNICPITPFCYFNQKNKKIF
jgi:endonuclease-3